MGPPPNFHLRLRFQNRHFGYAGMRVAIKIIAMSPSKTHTQIIIQISF